MTTRRYPRSLSEAFPCERAYAGFGPYRREGMLSRVLMWFERSFREVFGFMGR